MSHKINYKQKTHGKKMRLKFLYLMRQLFADTPVQSWPITSYIYEKVFDTIHKKQIVETEYKGVKLSLPTKDITIVPSIIGGYFESYELDLFKAIANKSEQIIDVGGNVGLYSILAAKNIQNVGWVYSFEPVPENIKFLKNNIKLNNTKRIKVIEQALGAKEGVLELFLSDRNIGTHSAAQGHSRGAESINVKLTTIDKFSLDNDIKPDLVKIDVEGYDGYVLDGGQETLNKYKPTIFIEYAPLTLERCGYSPENFLNQLFSIHKFAYIFEEKKNLLRSVSLKELKSLEVSCNRNLLFVSDVDHIEIIRKFL